jgi:hypothetical protein
VTILKGAVALGARAQGCSAPIANLAEGLPGSSRLTPTAFRPAAVIRTQTTSPFLRIRISSPTSTFGPPRGCAGDDPHVASQDEIEMTKTEPGLK